MTVWVWENPSWCQAVQTAWSLETLWLSAPALLEPTSIPEDIFYMVYHFSIQMVYCCSRPCSLHIVILLLELPIKSTWKFLPPQILPIIQKSYGSRSRDACTTAWIYCTIISSSGFLFLPLDTQRRQPSVYWLEQYTWVWNFNLEKPIKHRATFLAMKIAKYNSVLPSPTTWTLKISLMCWIPL